MRTASIASVPRRLAAVVGTVVLGALALLLLTAAPAAAHPGHGAEAAHDHALPLGGWALVVLALAALTVVGVRLMTRPGTGRV
jgi:hypothetical protein